MRLFRRRQLNPRSRRFLAAGILCLSSGFTLALSEARFHNDPPAIFHGMPFLVVGMAVILLLRSARRTGNSASRP